MRASLAPAAAGALAAFPRADAPKPLLVVEEDQASFALLGGGFAPARHRPHIEVDDRRIGLPGRRPGLVLLRHFRLLCHRHSLSRSRGAFLRPGFALLFASRTRNEGWRSAEITLRCSVHRRGVP